MPAFGPALRPADTDMVQMVRFLSREGRNISWWEKYDTLSWPLQCAGSWCWVTTSRSRNNLRGFARSISAFCEILGFERRNIGLTRHELKTKLKREILWCKFYGSRSFEQLETKVIGSSRSTKESKGKGISRKRLQQKESEWHNLKGQIRNTSVSGSSSKKNWTRFSVNSRVWSCLTDVRACEKGLDVEILGQKLTISSDAERVIC